MKKVKFMLFSATVIAVIAATLFVGCKKEKDETTSNETMSPKAQAMWNCIHHFQELRIACNSGVRSEGTMTLEDMRQTLCLMANFEHSEHETYCVNTTLDTLYVAMPNVDENGNVGDTDVVEAYNAFERALQECIANINDGRDVPSLFSIMLPQVGAKDSDNIRIVFTRGREAGQDPDSPTVHGPIEDLCLVWGLDGGYCNPTSFFNIQWDAADELSTYFTPDTTSPGNGSYQIFGNVEYAEYIATKTFMVENPYWSNYTYWPNAFNVTQCSDWLFFLSGIISGDEPCLCEDEMNCEWGFITGLIVSDTGYLHLSPNYHSEYYSCEVKDYYLEDKQHGDSICDRYHTALVCYADYYWVLPNPD